MALVIVVSSVSQLITGLVAARQSLAWLPEAEPPRILWQGVVSADVRQLVNRAIGLSVKQIEAGEPESWRLQSALRVRRRLKGILGCAAVDVIFLARDWMPLNRQILRAFPRARRICYGDGIGFYYTQNFASPTTRWPLQYFSTKGFRWDRYMMGWLESLANLHFDSAYLAVYPFGNERCPAKNVLPLDRKVFLDLLQWFVAAMPLDRVRQVAALSGQRLLLSSYCSESGRVSEENEVRGCVERAREFWSEDCGTLWIKPHPQDSVAKLQSLTDAMRKYFPDCRLLQGADQEIPVELLLASLYFGGGTPPSVLSFGSAALSLNWLFGWEVAQGFGAERIRQIYRPEHVAVRLRFESAVESALRCTMC